MNATEKNELTYNNLKMYLGTGLKVQHTTYIEVLKHNVIIDEIDMLGSECVTFEKGCDYYFDTDENECEIKPILYPIIQIKDIEEIMDEFSENSWEHFENSFFVLGRSLNCFDSITYTIAQLCFKHHIDIYGLIDKGLAIAVTDEFNPYSK